MNDNLLCIVLHAAAHFGFFFSSFRTCPQKRVFFCYFFCSMLVCWVSYGTCMFCFCMFKMKIIESMNHYWWITMAEKSFFVRINCDNTLKRMQNNHWWAYIVASRQNSFGSLQTAIQLSAAKRLLVHWTPIKCDTSANCVTALTPWKHRGVTPQRLGGWGVAAQGDSQGDTQDRGVGQRSDCVPVSTWATSLSSDPPPQAPAWMEKCNQTEYVWVAPGKLVVSVRLYLKVHLHIPPDDDETHPPGRGISQLFPAPVFRCWDRFSYSQRFQNSTI